MMLEGFTYFDLQRRLDFVFNDPQKCKRRVHLRDYFEFRVQVCNDTWASVTALVRWSASYLCQQFSPSLIKGPSMGLLPMSTIPSWAETGFQDGFDQSHCSWHV